MVNIALLAFMSISVFSLSIPIYMDSLLDTRTQSDVAIVLGAAVWNGRPSPVFEERIKHAVDMYHRGFAARLIFTGGVGEEDVLAESEVARLYAIEQGVNPEDIFTEKDSRITEQNLAGACRIMKDLGISRALIISYPLHMKRSVVMATSMGIEAYHSPTPTTLYRTWKSKFPSLLYETFFYGVYFTQRVLGLNSTTCQL